MPLVVLGPGPHVEKQALLMLEAGWCNNGRLNALGKLGGGRSYLPHCWHQLFELAFVSICLMVSKFILIGMPLPPTEQVSSDMGHVIDLFSLTLVRLNSSLN